MRCLTRISAILLIALLATSRAFAEDDIPQVLVLGDSVYQQPARDAGKELQGQADVTFVSLQPGEIRNTTQAIENIDRLLGDSRWDLIHFNFGLGDLVYRAPNMKAFRVMPPEAGGVRATSAQQYRRNLVQLVGRLKETDAILIWASTTPIRHSASNVFQLGSEVEYNEIAAKVMSTAGVPVNDMYAYVKEKIDMDRPASHGADPFFFDRKPLHPPITNCIVRELGLSVSKHEREP